MIWRKLNMECFKTKVRLLNSLRSQGLIVVQTKQMGQTKLIVIKLSRNAYTNKNDESIKNRQNMSTDQHQDMGNNCAIVIKRNYHGLFEWKIRKFLFQKLKKWKKFLSKLLNLVGSIFSLE